MHKGIDKVEFGHFFERKADAAAELLKKDPAQKNLINIVEKL